MLPALKSTKIKESESLNSTNKAYGLTKEHTNRELQRERVKTKLGHIMYGAPDYHQPSKTSKNSIDGRNRQSKAML